MKQFWEKIFSRNNFENVFLREQFWKCIFEGAILKTYLLREQFENVFIDGASPQVIGWLLIEIMDY